ncbi:MAG: YceI family protein [Proteobacteria bacterium]|nr:YceI family protein [Pseudomonadota bacterium]
MKYLPSLIAAATLLAAAPANAEHWNVDAAHSKLGFTVVWAKQPFTATFKSWKANIDFDAANLAASKADVTIAVGSMTSGDAETDAGVKGEVGFYASKFPSAHFVTTGFTHKSSNDYAAQGTLTLKGVTQPVTLPFTLTINGKTAHMAGSAVVMRNLFNVGTGQWAAPGPVAHEVKVNIDITATQN